jgi:calcyclin binding protein
VTQVLTASHLLNLVDASASYTKVRPDMVTVLLKKANVGEHWGYVSQKEAVLKDKKDKKLPKMDENADPQEGLMSLMKKMYEEGDDEMKRTISKAFIEGREKRDPGLDMMGM